ncbi:hypothetical protein N9044_00335 [bacterium]|jgi:hypothetical protein|nr:hypothetical protein [Akkermansiaceae bacterium]MDB4484215.1 hypothetical protein [bacterium]
MIRLCFASHGIVVLLLFAWMGAGSLLAEQEQYLDADDIRGGVPFAMVYDNGIDHKLGLKGLREYLSIEAKPEARFGTTGKNGYVFTSKPHQLDNRNYSQKLMFDLPGTRQYDKATFEKNLHYFGQVKWYGFAISPRTAGPERREAILFQTWTQGTSRAAAIKFAYAEDRARGCNVLRFIHHVDNPSDRRPLPTILASVDIEPGAWYKVILKIGLHHSGMSGSGSGHLQFWLADCGKPSDETEVNWGAEYQLITELKGNTIQNLVHEKLMIANRDVPGFKAEPSDSKDPESGKRFVWTTFGCYHPCLHEREFQVYFDEIRVGDSMEEVDPFRSCTSNDLKTHAARYSRAPMAPWKEWAENADPVTRQKRFPFLFADGGLTKAGADFLDAKYISQANFERGRFDGSMLTEEEFRKKR